VTAPARTLTAMLEVRGEGAVSGLTSVWWSLLELGEALTPDELEMPTACPGWTVKDQFSHVIGTELLLQGVGAPAPPRTYGPHVRNDLGALNERFVAARRAIPGQSVVAELAELVAHREAQLRRLEAEAAFAVGDGPVGIVPYVDYVSARTVDAFVHEQDVREAVGQPGGRGGLAERATLDRMEASMPFVLARRVEARAGTTVRVEVTGPLGRVVQLRVVEGADGARRAVSSAVIEGAPTATIRLDEVTFVRRACGRVSAGSARARVQVAGEAGLAAEFLEGMVVVA